MASVLSIKDVSKRYKRGGENVAVLEHFNLEIADNDFVAIMGPSGSGKTTLLNLIGGLDRPGSGEATVAGERLDQLSGSGLSHWRARHVGFIFQLYNLMPTLSAERNIELPLLLTSLSSNERKRKVAAALELVGLADRGKHKPGELSGGQQQRVAIARALIADPTILVCDEPTGDLDRHSADEILGLLQTLNRRYGKTIVMVTHDPKAAEYATRCLHLDKGQLIDEMPAEVENFAAVKPEYKTLPGWMTPTPPIRDERDLPQAARDYLKYISDALEVEIGMISTGPERDANGARAHRLQRINALRKTARIAGRTKINHEDGRRKAQGSQSDRPERRSPALRNADAVQSSDRWCQYRRHAGAAAPDRLHAQGCATHDRSA